MDNYFFFSSVTFVLIFNPRISSNFGESIFMNCSASFGTLKVIVLSFSSYSNVCRKRKSWSASIFSFCSVIILFILYI